VPRHLAPGTPDSFGDGLNLAQVRGVEGKDSIRLPQLNLLDDDGFSLKITGFRYCCLLSLLENPS